MFKLARDLNISLAEVRAMPVTDFLAWMAFYSYEAKVAEFEAAKKAKGRRR